MWFCDNFVVHYFQVYQVIIVCAAFYSKYILNILLYSEALFVRNHKEVNTIFKNTRIHTTYE